MGGQQGKPAKQAATAETAATGKPKGKRFRLRRLRKNHSDSLFAATSTQSLEKCDSLGDIHATRSPSCADLYRDVYYVEVDEGPEDYVRAYKDLKNAVATATPNERHALVQRLAEFVVALEGCNVREVRQTLVDKTLRLKAVCSSEMVPEPEPEPEKCSAEAIQRPTVNTWGAINARAMRTFEAFAGFTYRIEALKMRMIEYYGDDADAEFAGIMEDLQVLLADVRRVHDAGDLRVIVTREEYEDYLVALCERFRRLVDINMRHTRAATAGGMRRTNNISFSK